MDRARLFPLHKLRHWFGTELYRQSRDLRLTQEVMGHASPVTTASYAAWSPADAAVAVDQLVSRFSARPSR